MPGGAEKEDTMALIYPKNPRFNKLKMRTPDYASWQEGCAHDPSILEWDGTYYAYSTDTFGAPNGYQIRTSTDLLHWEYAGSAFEMEGTNGRYKQGKGDLQPAYDWCVTSQSEVGYGICTRRDGTMSFWAPDVMRGPDGKFWLYFCLTGYFGGSKSCIGLAKSDSPTGKFKFDSLLLCSPAGWRTPNCIDPQLLEAEGGKLYLVYGSYGLGLYLIELDPATGRRKDGRAYTDWIKKRCTFEEFYGTHIASGSVEGGVIRYHEGVDVLEDGKWTKKNYYYLMCSYGSLSSRLAFLRLLHALRQERNARRALSRRQRQSPRLLDRPRHGQQDAGLLPLVGERPRLLLPRAQRYVRLLKGRQTRCLPLPHQLPTTAAPIGSSSRA